METATGVTSPSSPSPLGGFALSPWEVLKEGGNYVITELGDNLRLRSSPSLTGETLTWLKMGEKIVVLEGPVEADDYLWWYVKVGDGSSEGWVADSPGWYRALESQD